MKQIYLLQIKIIINNVKLSLCKNHRINNIISD